MKRFAVSERIPKGTTAMALLTGLAVSVTLLFPGGTALAAPQYRAKMRVANVSINTTLANFPMLVRLSESRVGGFKYAVP